MLFRLILIILVIMSFFPFKGFTQSTDIRLKIAWILNDQYAGELYAFHKGWYKNSGINLVIKPHQASAKGPYHSVISGEADIGESETLAVLREAIRDGTRIVIFGLKDQISPAGFLSLEDKKITSPSKLKGLKFGYYNYGDNELLKWYCELNNINFHKIKKRKLPPNDMDPLISGTVDFIIAHETNEPVILKIMGYNTNFLSLSGPNGVHFGSAYFCKEYYYNIHKQELINFMVTSSKGWQHAITNPNEAAKIVMRYYPKNLLINNSKNDTLRKIEKGINIKSYYVTYKVGLDCIGCMSNTYWDIVLNELLSANIIRSAELAKKYIKFDVSRSLLTNRNTEDN